jgi:hypothetical protein
MLQQGQSHVANDIPKCFEHQNQQHHYETSKVSTSKVAAKGSKTTRKNIKSVVQHHTLHGDPCATNILNFFAFLRNNIVGGWWWRCSGPNLLCG